MLGSILLSIHNLHSLIDLVSTLRSLILEEKFQDFYKDYLERIKENGEIT
jgi:tRNA-guanine family transglycosylase